MSRKRYYLWAGPVEHILKAMGEGQNQVTVSTDLNRSVSTVAIHHGVAIFDAHTTLDKQQLLGIAKKKWRVFILEGNAVRIAESRDTHYRKLVPTEGAPTLEIDGVKMHRSKGIDPFDDAREKVDQVVKTGHRVLDTCGGLGYTAIWSLRLGAREVLSVEYDNSIELLRRDNPWSQELYDQRTTLVSADIFGFIQTLPTGTFDSILHDPPRFSLAGHLYGEDFYEQLHRVLGKGGALFHYTGMPYIVRRGDGFLASTAKRLRSVGFGIVIPKQGILGVKAVK
ncbi:MAG: hypothetical protein GXY19_20615 [Phycisphaerae bacterium]|nr:hypothetical protein [Phycisphaerae bacterium]